MLESQRKAIHRFKGEMFDLRRMEFEVEVKSEKNFVLDASVSFWNRVPGELLGLEERRWKMGDLI